MLREVSKYHYCSAEYFDPWKGGMCKDPCGMDNKCHEGCRHRKYKYPTPAQYEEDYDRKYPDDWAVYYRFIDMPMREPGWNTGELGFIKYHFDKEISRNEIIIVCAGYHWGKPPSNWVPYYN